MLHLNLKDKVRTIYKWEKQRQRDRQTGITIQIGRGSIPAVTMLYFSLLHYTTM